MNSKFDSDPDALAWARAKVQREIGRLENFMQQSLAAGNEQGMVRWRAHRNLLQSAFIGGQGCVVAAFDERLPVALEAIREK